MTVAVTGYRPVCHDADLGGLPPVEKAPTDDLALGGNRFTHLRWGDFLEVRRSGPAIEKL